jgi:conjugative relaxase-like TrwC/TraI family protein
MVGVTKITQKNESYWIQAVAEGGEDYYTKPGERPGQWLGGLADELGLDGEISPAEYAGLLSGKHPQTGAQLRSPGKPRMIEDDYGRQKRVEPILGYDIRFSAPKSVSLLWAIGDEDVQEKVLAAMDHAVAEGMKYMEDHACYVRRGKGGKTIERGRGFVSMNFLHRSSRAGDPALHSHVLTANMTRADSDGKWLALASPKEQSPLWLQAKPAGFVFQAALRAALVREFGVAWTEVENGHADLAEISREAIEHFSRRRAEILAEMAEHGTTSAAAAEAAAYRTRDAKDYGVDEDHQREDWRARGEEFDLTATSIEQLLEATESREPERAVAAHADVALQKLEETHSHFDRRDVVCGIAEQMGDGADRADLERAVDHLLNSEKVLMIHQGSTPLAPDYYTTPRLYALEKKVLAAAREGVGAGVAVVPEEIVAEVLTRHPYLSDEQVAMVRALNRGGDRIAAVAALPGAGKTTALDVAREAWTEAGIAGLGVATARSASGSLQDIEIPATSITSFLIRCENVSKKGRLPLPKGAVVLMDEASTTPTPAFAEVVQIVERCEAKLVVVGDHRQIGAVGPGGLFGTLTSELETSRLTEIQRQHDPLDREIVRLAHAGHGSESLDLLRTRERLVIADTRPEALAAMVHDWRQRAVNGEDAVMIARRTRDVAELNAASRALLEEEGALGALSVEVGEHYFAAGDQLITRVNSPLVSNRERWTVLAVDDGATHLKVQRIGGDERVVILTPKYLERRTESGEPAIQHAYALTTYSTQSKTFDASFVLLDSGIAREDFLVAVSRARGETFAYGVAASEVLDEDLGPAKRQVEDGAHDLRRGAERMAAEFSADEVHEQMLIAGIEEMRLMRRRRELLSPADKDPRDRGRAEKAASLDRRIAKLREEAPNEHDDGASKTRSDTLKRMAGRQLVELEAEREALGDPAKSLTMAPVKRRELEMIEARLLAHRRRTIANERLQPSLMMLDALGPRPEDPAEVVAWNEGVELVVGYRQRQEIPASERKALGEIPQDPEGRLDYRRTARELAESQRQLGREAMRAAERDTLAR